MNKNLAQPKQQQDKKTGRFVSLLTDADKELIHAWKTASLRLEKRFYKTGLAPEIYGFKAT